MAGLIPQSFIDDLLGRVDIVDVVESRVKLRKTGKNYSGLCPFHQEKTPSFTVEPEKQFYYCFGCGAGGNALGFVMNYENLEFPQAIESLARSLGVEVPREENARERERREKSHGLYAVLEDAARWFQTQLRRHPERHRAVDYLKGRGLSGEIARDFALGYAPPGWDNLLKALGGTEEKRKLLLNAGMLIEKEDKRLYDRFRDRIMYPIRDNRGRVIAFGGRVLGDDNPKYLNSPETPVFHKGEELYGLFEARRRLRNPERILIVEGYMDVIALAQSGIPYAVATLGTATSASHLRRLFRLVPEVVFCFDGDRAGREAAWRALQQAMPLMEDGRGARFLFLPEGEDPDTQVRKLGRQAFVDSLRDATPLTDFFFASLGEKTDLDSLEGKARLASLAMPHIRQVPAGVFHELLVGRLAQLTGLDSAALRGLASPAPPAAEAPVDAPPPPARRPPPRPTAPTRRAARPKLSACMKAVNLILRKPGMVKEVEIGPELAEVESPDVELLREVIALARHYPASSTPELMGRIYATPLGSQLIQLLDREQITPAEGVEHEFRDILGHLLATRRRRQAVSAQKEAIRQKLQTRRETVKSQEPEENRGLGD